MQTYEEILSSEPTFANQSDWRAIDKIMTEGYLPGFNSKIEIGTYDLYFKTGWYKNRIVKVDITISRGQDAMEDFPKSVRMAELEATRYDLAVRSAASACRDASSLLQSGVVGIGSIVKEWVGTEGHPEGWCAQIKDEYNPGPGATFVNGPLDAAAKLIRQRLPHWTEMIEALTNQEEDGS